MDSVSKCSVIIPTYNRARLLRRTLDSLVQQDLPRDQFEVLVVDDGSSDSTAEVVSRYRHQLDLRYFFQEDEGFRVAAARNTGIRHATGEVCIFTDSGVLLHAGCVRAHMRSHISSSSQLAVCGYVYCFSHNSDEDKQITEFVDVANPTRSIEAMMDAGRWPDVRDEFYGKYTDDFGDVPAPWFLYWTCNASASTEQLRAVGMFDETFQRWGGEDIDLGYRLHRAGARFMVDRRASALHYPHEKAHGALADAAVANYRYIAQKYATPITQLLNASPPLDFLRVNDLILSEGIPTCAEYTARNRAGDT